MVRVILERAYEHPYDRASFVETDSKLMPCLEVRGVKWIRSLVSADGLYWLCEFEAPDAEVIRSACRMGGIPFKRVWTAELLESEAEIAEWAKRVQAPSFI